MAEYPHLGGEAFPAKLHPDDFKHDRERRDEIETVGDHQLGSILLHS